MKTAHGKDVFSGEKFLEIVLLRSKKDLADRQRFAPF